MAEDKVTTENPFTGLMRTTREAPEQYEMDTSVDMGEVAKFGKRAFELAFNPVEQGKNAMASARLALDEATWGAYDHLPAILKGATDPKNFAQKYREGMVDSELFKRKQEEQLGTIGDLASRAVGAFSPISPVNYALRPIDTLFDAATQSNTLGGKALAFGKRLAAGGLSGSADAVLQDYFNNELEQAAYGAPAGFATGVGAQLVLGEIGSRLVRYFPNPAEVSNTDNVLNHLLDTGPTATRAGLDGANLTRSKEDFARDNTNMFTANTGEVPAYKAQSRLAGAVAKAVFPTRDTATRATASDFDEKFTQTLATLGTDIATTTQRIKTRLNGALGDPKSDYQRRQELKPKLAEYKADYNSLQDMSPGGKGQVGIKYQPLVDGIAADFANRVNGGSRVEDLPIDSGAAKMFGEVQKILHPRGHFDHTRAGTRAHHAEEPLHSAQVNMDTADTKLGQLMEAYKYLSNNYTKGVIRDGTVPSNAELQMASELREVIADRLDLLTQGKAGKARGGFARYMEEEDAFKLGAEFFSTGKFEEEAFGRTFEQTLDYYRKNNPAAAEAFRDGYKNAISVSLSHNGIGRTLNRVAGDINAETDLTKVLENPQGQYRQLQLALGEEEAETLVREFLDDRELLLAQYQTRKFLEDKIENPEAIAGIVRAQDDLILAAGFTPGQQAITSTGTMGALSRHMDELGVTSAEMLVNLAGARGEDFNKQLQRMLDIQAEAPSVSLGGRAASTLQSTTSDEEKAAMRKREKENSTNIADYLMGLVTPEP